MNALLDEESQLKALVDLQDQESQTLDEQLITQERAEANCFQRRDQMERDAETLHAMTRKRLLLVDELNALRRQNGLPVDEVSRNDLELTLQSRELPTQGFTLSTLDLERCLAESNRRMEQRLNNSSTKP